MATTYKRPDGAVQRDFLNARDFEEKVAEQIGVPNHSRFTAKDELDIWVPGYFLEVKEKRQRLNPRWHLLGEVPEEELMILDELTVRRALRHWPYVFFLLRDVPRQTMFLAPIWELVTNHHFTRVDRDGKGKWVIRLDDYRPLADLTDLHDIATTLVLEMPWYEPACLNAFGALKVQEVQV